MEVKMKKKLAKILAEEGLKSASGKIREFVPSDYHGWAGAEGWDDHEPWIAEIENVKFRDIGGDAWWEDSLDHTEDWYNLEENDAWDVTLIGDAEGLGIHLTGAKSYDQGPMFNLRREWGPEEAYGAMETALRVVKSGKIPRGYDHAN